MKFFLSALLIALSFSTISSVPVQAQVYSKPRAQSHVSTKQEKQQRKAQKKYEKAQKKAERAMLKTERKNSRRYPAKSY